ncbi:hypothetical protein PC128_g14433 [Phytophthora cactorum]|nr:hypothetical protein PC120_g7758 [Phytophthora cactorum]KAG3183001.1 hypothetical protein PC128_g14433 [Phytophthora cactorum]KAG4057572.1 hypothetical protein PC123_g7422 [Phytophthora cactorum]
MKSSYSGSQRGTPFGPSRWSISVCFDVGYSLQGGLGLNFLKATMTRDLDAGTVQGLEALARNWPRPSRSTFGMSSFGWGDWTRSRKTRLWPPLRRASAEAH